MSDHEKTYNAIIWQSDAGSVGQRVVVRAVSLEEAREKLEAEYGKGKVFNLHNKEDAEATR